MSAARVMVAFAAGATIAGMVVGVARLTDVVEPATAVADGTAAKRVPTPTSTPTPTGALEAGQLERSAAPSQSKDGAESRDAAPAAERDRATSEPRAQAKKTAPSRRWRAPDGAPEEVTAGVLARVASRRAQASRCEPARATAAAVPPERNQKPAAEATSCPPADGPASIEIEWNESSSTR